jgi:hypothetical protein
MEGCREKEIESLPTMSRLAIDLDRRSDRLPKTTTPWAKPVAFVISFT